MRSSLEFRQNTNAGSTSCLLNLSFFFFFKSLGGARTCTVSWFLTR